MEEFTLTDGGSITFYDIPAGTPYTVEEILPVEEQDPTKEHPTEEDDPAAENDWKHTFELPKFASDGHEIVYTVDEVPVKDYSTQINGYDLKNTYTGTPDTPVTPGRPNKPGKPNNQPETSDTSNIEHWIVSMILSGIGLPVMLAVRPKERYRSRYARRYK